VDVASPPFKVEFPKSPLGIPLGQKERPSGLSLNADFLSDADGATNDHFGAIASSSLKDSEDLLSGGNQSVRFRTFSYCALFTQ
jgi:hypothetical protein